MTDERDDTGRSDDSEPDGAGSETHDTLAVPSEPPDPESEPHVLPPEALVYPTFSFDSGDATWRTGFDLHRDLDDETLIEWLDSLAGATGSHDLAVEGSETRVTFGIRPNDVRMTYDPETDRQGSLDVTVSLDAYVVRSEDANARPTGARGDRGFIPFAMVTGDRDPEECRCYNWVDDPGTTTGECLTDDE